MIARLVASAAGAMAVRARMATMIRRAVLLTVALVLLVGALVLFLIAAWIALASATSSLVASLIIGGVLLILSLILLIIASGSGASNDAQIGRLAAETEAELLKLQAVAGSVSPLLPIIGMFALGFLVTGRRR